MGRVEAMAEVFEGDTDEVACVVDEDEGAGLAAGVEEEGPGGFGGGAGAAADEDPGGAPEVSCGIAVAGVEGRAAEAVFEVLQVRDVLVAERCEEAEFDEEGDFMVWGDDDIVEGVAAAAQLGHHGGVVVVEVDGDLAVVELFEFGDESGIDVFAPDEEVELAGGAVDEAGQGGEDEQEQGEEGGGGIHRVGDTGWAVGGQRWRWVRRWRATTARVASVEVARMRVERALMSGEMDRFTEE